jgi:hypothetical protein
MIICPWCGTNYLEFQSNCTNCGGPLQMVEESTRLPAVPGEALPVPPPAPRPISDRYVWKLLFSDGWAMAGLVFGILGLIFSIVGIGLTFGIITAFVGIPFVLMGIPFLGAGIGGLIWRYNLAMRVVNVLRMGDAATGQIVDVQENISVEVNGCHPWSIRYQFQANGQEHEGNVSTLNRPGENIQPGKPACILYLPDAPQWNSIYPHP